MVSTTPRPLYPRERPGTHCTGGWVGPRAGLERCGKSRPHRDSIPGPSSPWRVAIPTVLSRPLIRQTAPYFLPDFNQLWIFSTDFHTSSPYQISLKSVQWEPWWYMQTDGRTDTMKLIGDFRDSGNPPANNCSNLEHFFICVFIALSFFVHVYYLSLSKDTKHSFVSYVKLNAVLQTKSRQLWFYGAWSTQAEWPSPAACLGLSGLAVAKTNAIMGCIITNSMHSIANITHVYRTEPELRLAPRPLKEFQRCKDFNLSKNCTSCFKIKHFCPHSVFVGFVRFL